ncbi:hypothetical protein C8F01DRAFT_1163335 [Mycena amicta]|nr:hypothetical protein C8F01DRAFT_1163335 [Mycena amicta]
MALFEQPRALWAVWSQASAATDHTMKLLNPKSHRYLFELLGNIQAWFALLDDDARCALAALTLPEGTEPKSALFQQRVEALAHWIYTSPPPIELVDVSERSDYIDRTEIRFLARSQRSRRKRARLYIPARLIQELTSLREESMREKPAEHTIAKLNMISFFFGRTVLHAFAHAAHAVFSDEPTAPGLHRRHGREADLFVANASPVDIFEGKTVTGMRFEVSQGVFRYVDFTATKLLSRLAGVDWKYLSTTLRAMPTRATFSTRFVLGASESGTIRGCSLCESMEDDSSWEDIGMNDVWTLVHVVRPEDSDSDDEPGSAGARAYFGNDNMFELGI